MEKLPTEAKNLFSVMLALQDVTGNQKKESAFISQLVVTSVVLLDPRDVDGIKISLLFETNNGRSVEIEFIGQKAIRLMVLIVMSTNKKYGNPADGFKDDIVKKLEGMLASSYNVKLEHSRNTDLRKSINRTLNQQIGVKELIRNLAARNRASVWALAVATDQISIPNIDDRKALSDI
ncbi:MAG: hypothetical protein H7235_07670 [Bdellovibrionaceae bacterium]|nr:hypothetical protein [Pseudobdellovibrionaceae bacterium]